MIGSIFRMRIFRRDPPPIEPPAPAEPPPPQTFTVLIGYPHGIVQRTFHSEAALVDYLYLFWCFHADDLPPMSWRELAAFVLRENPGVMAIFEGTTDVPTNWALPA